MKQFIILGKNCNFVGGRINSVIDDNSIYYIEQQPEQQQQQQQLQRRLRRGIITFHLFLFCCRCCFCCWWTGKEGAQIKIFYSSAAKELLSNPKPQRTILCPQYYGDKRHPIEPSRARTCVNLINGPLIIPRGDTIEQRRRGFPSGLNGWTASR